MKNLTHASSRKTTRASTRILCLLATLIMVFSAVSVAVVPASAGFYDYRKTSPKTLDFSVNTPGLAGYYTTRRNVLYDGDAMTVNVEIFTKKVLFSTKTYIRYTVTYTFTAGMEQVVDGSYVYLNTKLTSGSKSASDSDSVYVSTGKFNKTLTLTATDECVYNGSFDLKVTVKGANLFGK